jgi:hypothetical protein
MYALGHRPLSLRAHSVTSSQKTQLSERTERLFRLLIAADPKAAKRNRSKRGEAQQPTARAAGAPEGSKDSFALVPVAG